MEDFQKWYSDCQQDLRRVHEDKDCETICRTGRVLRKTTPEFTKYKYSEACHFKEKWQFAARGSTTCSHQWSFCLNKFFGPAEMQSRLGVSLPEMISLLQNQAFTFAATPKWDGSCVQIFHDGSKLQIFTLGCLHEASMSRPEKHKEKQQSFAAATRALLPDHVEEALRQRPFHTLIMELCTPHNRIVTQYGNRSLLQPIVDIAPDGLPRWTLLQQLGWTPTAWGMTSPSESVLDFASSCAESMVRQPELYGQDPEGVVLYALRGDLRFPIAKLKRAEYLSLHRGLRSPEAHLCLVQKLVLEGKADDLEDEASRQHAAEFEKFLEETEARVETWAQCLKDVTSRKEFAAKLLAAKFPTWLQQSLFRTSFPLVGDYSSFVRSSLTVPILSALQHGDNCFWFKKLF